MISTAQIAPQPRSSFATVPIAAAASAADAFAEVFALLAADSPTVQAAAIPDRQAATGPAADPAAPETADLVQDAMPQPSGARHRHSAHPRPAGPTIGLPFASAALVVPEGGALPSFPQNHTIGETGPAKSEDIPADGLSDAAVVTQPILPVLLSLQDEPQVHPQKSVAAPRESPLASVRFAQDEDIRVPQTAARPQAGDFPNATSRPEVSGPDPAISTAAIPNDRASDATRSARMPASAPQVQRRDAKGGSHAGAPMLLPASASVSDPTGRAQAGHTDESQPPAAVFRLIERPASDRTRHGQGNVERARPEPLVPKATKLAAASDIAPDRAHGQHGPAPGATTQSGRSARLGPVPNAAAPAIAAPADPQLAGTVANPAADGTVTRPSGRVATLLERAVPLSDARVPPASASRQTPTPLAFDASAAFIEAQKQDLDRLPSPVPAPVVRLVGDHSGASSADAGHDPAMAVARISFVTAPVPEAEDLPAQREAPAVPAQPGKGPTADPAQSPPPTGTLASIEPAQHSRLALPFPKISPAEAFSRFQIMLDHAAPDARLPPAPPQAEHPAAAEAAPTALLSSAEGAERTPVPTRLQTEVASAARPDSTPPDSSQPGPIRPEHPLAAAFRPDRSETRASTIAAETKPRSGHPTAVMARENPAELVYPAGLRQSPEGFNRLPSLRLEAEAMRPPATPLPLVARQDQVAQAFQIGPPARETSGATGPVLQQVPPSSATSTAIKPSKTAAAATATATDAASSPRPDLPVATAVRSADEAPALAMSWRENPPKPDTSMAATVTQMAFAAGPSQHGLPRVEGLVAKPEGTASIEARPVFARPIDEKPDLTAPVKDATLTAGFTLRENGKGSYVSTSPVEDDPVTAKPAEVARVSADPAMSAPVRPKPMTPEMSTGTPLNPKLLENSKVLVDPERAMPEQAGTIATGLVPGSTLVTGPAAALVVDGAGLPDAMIGPRRASPMGERVNRLTSLAPSQMLSTSALSLASQPKTEPTVRAFANPLGTVDGRHPLGEDNRTAADVPLDVPASAPIAAALGPMAAPDQSHPGATTASASHSASQDHGHHPLPKGFSTGLAHSVLTTGQNRAELILEPVELGRLRFDLVTQGDQVQVILAAERPETLDLLRRHADELKQEFKASGLDTGTLSFSQWGKGGDDRDGPALPLMDKAPDDLPPVTPAPSSAPGSTVSGSGLDLRL